jgi:beta-lactam-binding protein with PASTA domain
MRSRWLWFVVPAALTTALLSAFAAFAGDDNDPARPVALTSAQTTTTASPPPPPRPSTTTTRAPTRTTTTRPQTTTRNQRTTTTTASATTTTTRAPATTTRATTTARATTTTRPRATRTRSRAIARVPNLYGATRREALDLLDATGFRGRPKLERSIQPQGFVFKQTPRAGAPRRQGTTVSFAISFQQARRPPPPPPAPAVSSLPPLVGLDYPEAAARLALLGIHADANPVRTTRRKVGYVVSQTPAARTRAARGSRVTLTVSLGRGRLPESEVPDTVGLKELAAHELCRDEDFLCRTVAVPTQHPSGPGRVVRQRPNAGEVEPELTQMTLFVGK